MFSIRMVVIVPGARQIVLVPDVMDLGRGHEVPVHPRPLEVDDGIRARPHLQVLALVETPAAANQVVRARLLVGIDERVAHRDARRARRSRTSAPDAAGRTGGFCPPGPGAGMGPPKLFCPGVGRRRLFAANGRVLHSRVLLCRGRSGAPRQPASSRDKRPAGRMTSSQFLRVIVHFEPFTARPPPFASRRSTGPAPSASPRSARGPCEPSGRGTSPRGSRR